MEELICITCPKGCTLKIQVENHQILSVTGNGCPRGISYAESEILHPMRMVTSTVKITGAKIARCPVMTSKPIPKDRIFDVMHEIEQVNISSPVIVDQVLIRNICGLDADLVATRSLS